MLRKVSESLNPLREQKRETAYRLWDIWRSYSQREELNKTVNNNEIRVIGLRRTGNHAIISWIKAQVSNPYFLNNVGARTSPFRFYHLHFPNDGYRDEAWGKFSRKDCLIYSYEDYSIADIADPAQEKKHDLYVGKTKRRYDVLILRDPFNLIASRLSKGYLDVKNESLSMTTMWIEHAKEFLGETSLLKGKRVFVNYNDWFSDESYRQSISRDLDLAFSDAGLNYVSSYGGGSSFESQAMSGQAQKMNVLERWKKFKDDERFLALIDNEELRYYSDRIFPKILNF